MDRSQLLLFTGFLAVVAVAAPREVGAILPPVQTSRFYISSFSGNAIEVYNPDGTHAYGLGADGLFQPRGIVFLPNGQFLVASQSTDRIFRFGADESDLGFFTHAQLDAPTGMAIHDGKVYACSFNNDQVVVFDFDGNYQLDFTGGGLNGPNCIAFDSQGFAYVSSANTGTLVKFDPAQNHDVVDVFVPDGVTLSSPMSIARNTNDVLYVSGGGSNNIVKFSTSGETLGEIPLPGFAPQGIAFDTTGHLWTTSFTQDTIKRFDSNDVEIETIDDGLLNVPRSIAFAHGATGGEVPAASTWGLAGLAVVLMGCGGVILRRRHAT